MSRIETRQNLFSVDSLSKMYSSAPILCNIVVEVLNKIDSSIESKIEFNTDSLHTNETKSIPSPVTVFQKFEEAYSKSLQMGFEKDPGVTKNDIIQLIMQTPFRIVDSNKIEQKVKRLYNSEKSTLKNSADNLITELKQQHCTFFSNELKEIVSLASKEAGFSSVNVRTNELNPVIVALDKEGKGIVSEIKIDNKSMQIDLISEIIGVTDGSCNKILSKFGDALKKYGVKNARTEDMITGGNCQNPISKKVNNDFKLSKERNLNLLKIRKQSNKLKLKN